MAIYLQHRDAKIARDIASCGFLTTSQLARVHFDGSDETAAKRLRKLERAGLLVRHATGRGRSCAFALSPASALAMSESGALGSSRFAGGLPKPAALRHEIAVRDLRAAILSEAPHSVQRAPEICIDPRMLAFADASGGATRPDGHLRIRTANTTADFFLEVDLGTEAHRVLTEKVRSYRRFMRSGGFAARCGITPERSQERPFRVLFAFASEARRLEFLQRAAAESVREFVLAAGLADALRDPYGAVWSSPASAQRNERRALVAPN